MNPITYATRKYLVLHGHANATPALVAYNPPSKIWTGHDNFEDFDDPQAAIDRAIELGVKPLLTSDIWPHDKSFNLVTGKLVDLSIEDFDSSKQYPPGAVVRYTLAEEVDDGEGGTEQVSTELLFLKISDTHPSVPDMTFDEEAGTGDWVVFYKKEAPPEPDPREAMLATLEARLKALEAR